LLKAVVWGIGLLAAGWTISFGVAMYELNEAINALKARGEPTTFAEAVAQRWAEAGDQPGIDFIWQAIAENDRLGRPADQAIKRVPVDADFGEEERRIYAEAAQKCGPVLRLLEQAVTRPPAPFTRPGDSIDESRRRTARIGPGMVRATWPALKLASLRREQAEVVRLLVMLYRLSDQYSAEPSSEGASVQGGVIMVINDLARTLVPAMRLDDEQFRRLDAVLDETLAGLKYSRAYRGQRVLAAERCDDLKELRGTLQNLARRRRAKRWDEHVLSFLDLRWVDLVVSPLGLPVRRRAAAQALRIPDEVLGLVDEPRPWSSAKQQYFEEWWRVLSVDRLSLRPNETSSLENAFTGPLMSRRGLTMMRLGVRLKRFADRYGRLPERLEEICDAAMPELPTTWFEGAPFIYTKEGLAFRIEPSKSLPGVFAGPKGDFTDERYGVLLKMDFGKGSKSTKP